MKSWFYFFLGLIFLSGLLAWSLFCVPYLPTNDGPQHILSAYIENHYDDPGSIYPSYLTRMPQFAYRGFSVIMKPMERAFGWQLGAQFAILIILLLNAWGFTAMVLALNPKRRWVAYLGFPLAWSWSLYMGFFAFMVGTGLGYWIVAYVLAIKKWNWIRWGTLAGLLWLQAMAHVFTGCLTGLLVACLLVSRERILTIGLVGLPAMSVAFRTLWQLSDLSHLAQAVPSLLWVPWQDYIRMFPHMLVPGLWSNLIVWLLLILFTVGLAVLCLLKKQSSFEDKIFSAIGLIALLIFIFGPRDIRGWQLFGQRFIQIGISSLLILIPLERLKNKRLEVAASLFMFTGSLVSIVSFSEVNQGLAYSCKDLIVAVSSPEARYGIDHFVPLSVSCGLEAPSEMRMIPYSKPEVQAGALFAAATNSMPDGMFAGSAAQDAFMPQTKLVHVSREAPFKGIGLKRLFAIDLPKITGKDAVSNDKALVYALAAYGMNYQYQGIFVTGADQANVNLLKSMGFVEEQSYGTIWVGHFEPCKIIFKTSSLEDLTPKINLGFYPLEASILIDVAAKKNSPGVYEYPYAPCGDVWIQMQQKSLGTFSIEDPQKRPYLKNQVFVKDSL